MRTKMNVSSFNARSLVTSFRPGGPSAACVMAVGLLGIVVQAQGQLLRITSPFQKPQVPVTITHPGKLGVMLAGKKVAFGQITGNCAQEFADLVMQDFVRRGVDLVNRADLSAILAEHHFQVNSSSVDPATAVQIGKLLGPAVMIFVNVSRCATQQSHLNSQNQFSNTVTYISRTEAHFLASIHTVDLASGRELAVERIQADPKKEYSGGTPYPEYPGEFEVKDLAIHESSEQVFRLYFPWTETRRVSFMDNKDCNLRQAYDLLKTGDHQSVLKLSLENVERCKSDPKVNHQADAWYNLGVAYMLVDEYDKALDALSQSQRLHSDKTVIATISECRNAMAAAQATNRRERDEEQQKDAQRDRDNKQAEQAAKPVLTNEDIINSVKSGMGEDLVVKMIASQPAAFSVTPRDLLALKKAGVPDKVLSAMLDKK